MTGIYVQRGRDFWEEVMDEYELVASQMNLRQFAEHEQINYSTWCDWARKLRRERDQAHEPSGLCAHFVEVQTHEHVRTPGAGLVVELAGARLHFETLPQPAWLGALLTGLDAARAR